MEIKKLDSIDGMYDLAKSWEKTCNGFKFGIETKAECLLGDVIRLINFHGCAAFGIVNDNIVVGFIGMRTFKNPLGSEMIAEEHYWYVIPEFRKSIFGIKLIKTAEKWAKEKGCSHIIMNASNLASDLHNKICSMYERLGMKKFETQYIKPLR